MRVYIVVKWSDVKIYGEEIVEVYQDLLQARNFVTTQHSGLIEKQCGPGKIASWEFAADPERGFAIEEKMVVPSTYTKHK